MTGTGVVEARPATEVLAWSRQLVDPPLREAVDTLPASLRQIAGYHFGWWDADGRPTGAGAGGKAIRPVLVLLAARATGGDPLLARPAAVAVELVHNYSLIQDDVIAGDLTRWHRPTVWSVFGTGAAILAGSGLLARALDVLAATEHPAAPQATRLLSGAAVALLDGQHADLAVKSTVSLAALDRSDAVKSTASLAALDRSDAGVDRTAEVDLAECIAMARAKSGVLLGCAAALGATFAPATAAQVRLLRDFGERFGLACQLADDLLGIWGDPAVTGKPVHSDLRRRKKSLPVVAALTSGTDAGDELAALYRGDRPLADRDLVRAAELVDRAGGRTWSRAKADELIAEALRSLRSAADPTGPAVVELAALARH